MNGKHLTLAQLAHDLEKLNWVRYQISAFIPSTNPVNGELNVYLLTEQQVYFLHPDNETIFRKVIEQAGLVPHRMQREDWDALSPRSLHIQREIELRGALSHDRR